MVEKLITDKDPVVYSARRKRSLNRERMMDIDKGINPDQLPPETPVVIYSRVSSEEQVQGYSLEAQVNACKVFATQRKWKIVKCYSDPGHSGKDDKRPGFTEMITDAKTGQFKVILFHKLDRFSRNSEQIMRHFRDLNSCDVTIGSVTEDFDYTTALGRLVFRMMAIFAQWYLENLSAEVVKSKIELARHGIQNGPVPFGYIKDQEKKQVLIIEEEAQLVRSAFELYASGNYTDQTIADFLNQTGVKTRRGNKWSKDTVTDFLQNEFFYGKVAYRDQLWPGRQEPIISQELFDKAKDVRAKHAHRPGTYKGMNKVIQANLLQRIVCCSHCERPLRLQSTRRYGYYVESSAYRGKDCAASFGRVSMLTVDRLAFDLLRSVKLPEEWHKEIERMIQSMDVVRKIENRRIEIDEELRRAGRAFADGAFNEEDYDRRRKKLFAEKDSLILPDGAKTIEIGMQLENIGDFLEEATNDEKYKIFHILFDTISYDFSKKKMVKFKPHTEFVHIFRLAAPMSDWTETDGYIFQVEKQ